MDKIINLFKRKKEKEEEKEEQQEDSYDFAAVIEKNKKLKDQASKERSKQNKSVLRSYRIKN